MFYTSLDSPIFSLSNDVMFDRVTIESNRGKDDLNLHCDQGAYGVWYFDDVPEVGHIRRMVHFLKEDNF